MAARMLLLKIGGAIVICAGSFWVTLLVLDYRDTANRRLSGEIQIVEASYGRNCRAKTGNFTDIMAQTCAGKTGACSFIVDLSKTADPAVGCAKDFVATWKCGLDHSVHQRQLSPEALGKTITVECPPK